jgi:hypothetical protein
MNQQLDEKLCADFPDLYRGRNKSIKESAMPWGFECGDGWFKLIYDLSKEITDYCSAVGIEVPETTQVKEKFGTLRFYLMNESEAITEMIEDAENKSANTCEVCGYKGKLMGKSWLKVRCPQHVEI